MQLQSLSSTRFISLIAFIDILSNYIILSNTLYYTLNVRHSFMLHIINNNAFSSVQKLRTKELKITIKNAVFDAWL